MLYSARFLIAADALDSVLTALLGQPWRIIIADDGPHDNLTTMCGDKYDPVRVARYSLLPAAVLNENSSPDRH